MARLWGRIMRHCRKIQDKTVECVRGEEHDALMELCQFFDIPMPLWLDKHESEYEAFGHTSFTQEHFMEPIRFDKLEIEYLEDGAEPRRSKDPRNQF